MTYLGDPDQWTVYRTTLTVGLASAEFVGRDIVRIHVSRRGDFYNHQVVKLSANGRSHFVVVRGRRDDDAVIEMDDETRFKFGLLPRDTREFTIEEVSWIGQARWYISATDPVIRIPAVLGMLSLALGVIGVALGAISLWK